MQYGQGQTVSLITSAIPVNAIILPYHRKNRICDGLRLWLNSRFLTYAILGPAIGC